MKKKIRIGVVFGGKSAEHEVSLQSARNVINSLDKNKYEVVPIGIDKKGKWLLGNPTKYLLNEHNPKLIRLNTLKKEVTIFGENSNSNKLDVIFPALHGPYVEDGSVQGLLKLADIPFVGAGVLGSAVGMDKDVMKRLLRDAGIPIVDFIASNTPISFNNAKRKLGLPLFIKPANTGSSVGISKVKNKKEFDAAMKDAFKYDTKIIIEE